MVAPTVSGSPAPKLYIRPEVTVVVVCHNDAHRLPRAVASVTGQSLRSVEAVIVDDASTDGSHAVAVRLEAANPHRVRALRLARNSGSAGAPRNAGLEAARGRYLMFLDSDDELDQHACRNLVAALEDTGADFSMGLCVRLVGPRQNRREPWLPEYFARSQVLETVHDAPELLAHDTISTNKCYRRTFLDAHALRYPEGLKYEDLLFMAEAYLAAKRIAVVPAQVYTWRVRESSSSRSVTNSRHDIGNVTDRIEIHRRIDALLGSDPDPRTKELRRIKDLKFLHWDLRLHLADLPYRELDFREQLADLFTPYLRALPDHAYDSCRTLERVGAELLLRRDWPCLERLADALGHRGKQASPLVHGPNGLRWCACSSGTPQADRRLDVGDLGYDRLPLEKLNPGNALVDCTPLPHGLHLGGRIANPAGAVPPDTDVTGWLQVRARHMPLQSFRVPLTSLSNDGHWLTWEAVLDRKARIRPLGLVDAHWDISLQLRVNGTEVPTRITAAAMDQELLGRCAVPVRPRFGRITGDVLVPEVSAAGHLAFRLEARGTLARCAVPLADALRRNPAARRAGRRLIAWRKRLGSLAVRRRVYRQILVRLPRQRHSYVFESHMGRGYCDSPRAVLEELLRQFPTARTYWSYAGSRPQGLPPGVVAVRRNSWRYHLALARARFWVDNQGFPPDLPKPRGTAYVQTWHGTAIKRMGFDLPEMRARSRAEQDQAVAAAQRIDWFLTRSEHDQRTLVEAFRLNARVLRCGYPRNDMLLAPRPEQVARAAELRRSLGIREGTRTIVYAPTFRRDPQGRVRPLEPPFDLHAFAERHGAEHTLLVRAHYLSRFTMPPGLGKCVVDVSAAPETGEVLLIADALVTDYSSVCFDYALMDRPLLFFQPDRDAYAVQGPGTHLDLGQLAPELLVETATGFLDIIPKMFEDPPAMRAARRRLRTEFGEHDQGDAAQQVVRQILHPSPRRKAPAASR